MRSWFALGRVLFIAAFFAYLLFLLTYLITLESASQIALVSITMLITVFTFVYLITMDPTRALRRNRRQLIKIVHENWIEEYLQDTINNYDFELDFDDTLEYVRDGEVVDANFDVTSADLMQTLQSINYKLLIVGERGSGKTITLLKFLQRLLEQTTPEQLTRIPVILNLSSWATGEWPRLDAWVLNRLQRDYGVPASIAKTLTFDRHLLLLIEGFDEIDENKQEACMDAIKTFTARGQWVIVTCRPQDQPRMARKLDVNSYLRTKPLTAEHFAETLRQSDLLLSDEDLKTLMYRLTETEEITRHLMQPLFLGMLIHTYKHVDQLPDVEPDLTVTEIIQQMVVKPYLAVRLTSYTPQPYRELQTTHNYLNWLGWQLTHRRRSLFYVKELQAYWLRMKRQNAYYLSVILYFAAIIGISWLLFGQYGLIFWLVGLILRMSLPENTLIRFNNASQIPQSWHHFLADRIDAAAQWTIIPVMVGVVLGAFIALVSEQITLVQALSYGPATALALFLAPTLLGLPLAFVFLAESIKRPILRWQLIRQGSTPSRFDLFFKEMRDIRLMRKVGTGMMFSHRYLQEYFADHYPPTEFEQILVQQFYELPEDIDEEEENIPGF